MTNAWAEYDRVAESLAKRGLTGNDGDPLPAMLSTECLALINDDTDAFRDRVKSFAYALRRAETIRLARQGAIAFGGDVDTLRATFDSFISASHED